MNLKTQLAYITASIRKKWSKSFDIKPQCSRRRTVEWYSPGSANVSSYKGTLACGLGSAEESTSATVFARLHQTAVWSV